MNDPYLTVDEVAAIFAVKNTTIREWCRTGKLKAVHIGKYWRIRHSDMVAYAQREFGDSA